MFINYQILNVKGRSDLFLKAEVIKKIVAIGILCATLPFGMIWLCIGVVIYNVFDVLLIISFTKKAIPLGYRLQFRALFPIFSITMVSALSSFTVCQLTEHAWINLIVGTTIFTAVFIFACYLFKINEISQIKQILHIK